VKFKKHLNGEFTLQKISENGIFHRTFKDWYDEIGKYDFVLGARLHGCIAALNQGIPAVMIARDIRVEEIAAFFKIPFIRYSEVQDLSIEEIYERADFTDFNDAYSHRYNNFIKFLDQIDVINSLTFEPEIPLEYHYSKEDLNA